MTYIAQEKVRAAAWKRSTTALPAEAKSPVPYIGKDGLPGTTAYDFCLPPELAAHTLLPDIRERALDLFAELQIPWHAGTPAGPSNHLLSSQVQCVNALTAMVDDPARIQEVFGVSEVLQIEPGRYLTFEYIGPRDYFGEAPSGERIRGAHCTSVDAAFLHRLGDGTTELVLVEWKYTESYRPRKPDARKDAVRFGRYGEALADSSGPVRLDLLAFQHLLDEPFYQLVRQQLLAHALEHDGVADRVRVVHVLSPDNDAYQQSLARPEHLALGSTVSEVWRQLLRRTDCFASLDPGVFLDPAVTSREYCLRYSPKAVHDPPSLFDLFGVEDAAGLEDRFDGSDIFDGDVLVDDYGVELLAGRSGLTVPFPFLLNELYEAADDVTAEAEEDDTWRI